jgi:hypothetical protein
VSANTTVVWWEAILMTLAILGAVGSVLATLHAFEDMAFARSSVDGKKAIRTIVAAGYVREALVALSIQAAILLVAFVYVLHDTLAPPTGMVWTIRGSIVAIEVLLLVQIALRHYERKRLAAAVSHREA